MVVIGKWRYFFCYLPVVYDEKPEKTVGVGEGSGLAQPDSSVAWVVAVGEGIVGISRRAWLVKPCRSHPRAS